MQEQRPRQAGSALSRRDALRGGAVLAGGLLAGCASVRGGNEPVSLLVAGSLNNATENGLRDEIDAPIRVEAHGSAALARMVSAGQKDPHVVSVADAALFRAPLDPPWYAELATNSIVLAFNSASAGGREIAAGDPDDWYVPLLSGAVDLGRTDPDLDPLGYRTRFVLDLASRYYGVRGLRDRVLDESQVYPETQLLAAFETGAIDAAFAYRSMAIDRGYDFVELPDEVDLSDPTMADEWYGTTGYELPDGTSVRGGVIRYVSTLRRETPPARSVFEAHVGGEYLTEFGFVVPENFPKFRGDVPNDVR